MTQVLVIAPLLPDAFVFLPKKDLHNSRDDFQKDPDSGDGRCCDAHLPGKSDPLLGKGYWDSFFSHIVFVPQDNFFKGVTGLRLVGFVRKEVARKEYQNTNAEQNQKNALQDTRHFAALQNAGPVLFFSFGFSGSVARGDLCALIKEAADFLAVNLRHLKGNRFLSVIL